MDETVKSFIESPSVTILDSCTKKQLVVIGDYYKVDVGDQRKSLDFVEETLKARLIEQGVLESVSAASVSAGVSLSAGASVSAGASGASAVLAGSTLTFEQQRELLYMQLEIERLKNANRPVRESRDHQLMSHKISVCYPLLMSQIQIRILLCLSV